MSAASGENQSVMSPRCTSARSYSAQLLTRYFVLYLGWTLEFMLRMWPIGPKGPPRSRQLAHFLYDSCTNAAFSEYSASGVFDQLMEEDRLLCERVQRGMRARHGKGGSLVSLDRPIANLHRYLGWRLFDTEPPKQWIAPE